MSTPFEAHRGNLQQRIATANASVGAHAYELGHARHLDVNLDAGDGHAVSQTFDFAPQAVMLRCVIRIFAPPTLPPDGMHWELQVLLNGQERYRRLIDVANRVLVLSDIVVRLEWETSVDNEITYRLGLV
jgi:hypothetical protein